MSKKDNETEVTHHSAIASFADTGPGVAAGAVLLVISLGFFVWHEMRAARMQAELRESRSSTVTVDSGKVDPANEGKLVHVQGETKTEDTVADDRLGVSRSGLRLVRKVEMYQWMEEKSAPEKGADGKEKEPTYSYKNDWSEKVVPSAGYKEEGHQNPTEFPENLKSAEWVAKSGNLGAFSLKEDVLKTIGKLEPIEVQEADLEKIEEGLKGKLKVASGGFFLGEGDGSAPKVGDVRITFVGVKPGPATMVAKQAGSGLEPYKTASGREVMIAREGSLPLELMFENEESKDFIFALLFRMAGWVALAAGIALLLGPLSALSRKSRLVAEMLMKGSIVFGCVWATILSLLVAAIAWAPYRPQLAAGFGVVALLVLFEYRRQTKLPDWIQLYHKTSWTT